MKVFVYTFSQFQVKHSAMVSILLSFQHKTFKKFPKKCQYAHLLCLHHWEILHLWICVNIKTGHTLGPTHQTLFDFSFTSGWAVCRRCRRVSCAPKLSTSRCFGMVNVITSLYMCPLSHQLQHWRTTCVYTCCPWPCDASLATKPYFWFEKHLVWTALVCIFTKYSISRSNNKKI